MVCCAGNQVLVPRCFIQVQPTTFTHVPHMHRSVQPATGCFINSTLSLATLPEHKNYNQQRDPPLHSFLMWGIRCSQFGSLETALTFGKQELHGAQVTLAGCNHQQGPALLVTDVDICAVLQQQLSNLRRGKNKTNPKHHTQTRTHELQ